MKARTIILSLVIVFSCFAFDNSTNALAAKIRPIPPIDPTITKLPPKFFGTNPFLLYKKMMDDKKIHILGKNEFETTRAYEQKLTVNRKIMDSKYGHLYAFMITDNASSYDADLGKLSVKKDFDDDIRDEGLYKMLTVKASQDIITRRGTKTTTKTDYIRGRTIILTKLINKKGKYIARNAFNAKVVVERKTYSYIALAFKNIYGEFSGFGENSNNFSMSIDLTAQEAKEAKAFGKLMIIARPIEPYIGYEKDYHAAKFDDPEDATISHYYLAVEPVEIWFYNIKTGTIYKKTIFEKNPILQIWPSS